MKKVLKYIGKVLVYTILTIVVTCGLALLFVFVTAKIAISKGETPPVNLYTIISPSMTPNINVYDVVVTFKTDPKNIVIGDVITFYSDNPNLNGLTITHRVVQLMHSGDTLGFQTKGDYNQAVDTFIVPETELVGKVVFKVPQLGRVQFFLASKGGWIIAILIPALAVIAYDIYKIIKLILIKQKIIEFQSQEDIPSNKTEVIVTIQDIYKDEPNQTINNNENQDTNKNDNELPKF